MIRADVAVEAEGWAALDAPERLGQEAVRAAIEAAGVALPEEAELTLLFSDDAAVRDLNRRFRGKDRPTNVLSFPPARPGAYLGDIVLALETVAAEAGEQGKALRNHTAHLIVHGVLHLLGHDHETEAEAEAMEAIEVRALARLGIADPYRARDEEEDDRNDG